MSAFTDAAARVVANDARLHRIVNLTGGYTTADGAVKETIPDLMVRKEGELTIAVNAGIAFVNTARDAAVADVNEAGEMAIDTIASVLEQAEEARDTVLSAIDWTNAPIKKMFATMAAATAGIGTIANGEWIEVVRDESVSVARPPRTRYEKVDDEYEFRVNLDIAWDDLRSPLEGLGVDMVRGAYKCVDSAADARALTDKTLSKFLFIGGDDGGIFYRKASDTTSAENGGGACGTILRDTAYAALGIWERHGVVHLNVKWFDAKGNDTDDDTLAIQLTITVAETSPRRFAVVFFPDGVYKTTAELRVTVGNLSLIGENYSGATAYSPLGFAGPMIRGYFDRVAVGDAVIRVQANDTSVLYANFIKGLRVGVGGTRTNPPNGITFAQASEFRVEEVRAISGLRAGLRVDGASIANIDFMCTGENQYGMDFVGDSAGFFTTCEAIWVRNANLWKSSIGSVRVACSNNTIIFRDGWAEYSPACFLFDNSADLVDHYCSGLVADGFRFSSTGDGPADSRYIKVILKSDGTKGVRLVGPVLRNLTTNNHGATYNIEYVKGANTSPNAYIEQMIIDGATFLGASTGAVYSDTGLSTVFFQGRVTALNAPAGAAIPLTAGSVRLHKMITAFGAWDMSGSFPIRLPTQSAVSFATPGYFWFDLASERAYVTSGSAAKMIPVRGAAVANSAAADIAGVNAKLNELLGVLRTAGSIAT